MIIHAQKCDLWKVFFEEYRVNIDALSIWARHIQISASYKNNQKTLNTGTWQIIK